MPLEPTPMQAAVTKAEESLAAGRAAAPEGSPQHQSTSAPTTTQNGTPASAPVADSTPAPTAAQKRLLKAKFDHEEKDIDFDEWAKEQWEKGRAKEVVERDYGFDRRLERERREAIETTRKAWNDFVTSQNYNVVQDPTHPSGWKIVPKQVATPAEEPADPLAKEEAELQVLADDGDAKAIRRLAQIAAERAKRDAIREIDDRLKKAGEAEAAKQQEAVQRSRYEEAKQWLLGETDKFIAARAKSFEGPDQARRVARLRQAAFVAGEAAARSGQDAVKAAQAVIFEEADDLDARASFYRQSMTTMNGKPEAPPIVGTAPAVGSGSAPKYKNIREAVDAIEDSLQARR